VESSELYLGKKEIFSIYVKNEKQKKQLVFVVCQSLKKILIRVWLLLNLKNILMYKLSIGKPAKPVKDYLKLDK
jgi:hypothetical protein